MLYLDGKIERKAAIFLVELHKRVPKRSPAFESFFYKVLKDHVLANGRIEPGDVKWLREVLLSKTKSASCSASSMANPAISRRSLKNFTQSA